MKPPVIAAAAAAGGSRSRGGVVLGGRWAWAWRPNPSFPPTIACTLHPPPPPRPPHLSSSSSPSPVAASAARTTTTTTTTFHSDPHLLTDEHRNSNSNHRGSLPYHLETQTLEARIEKVIYGCRFMAFLAIAGSLVGSILCFLTGCVYVKDSFVEHLSSGGKVILMLVEAIDIYLIGTVMLVFGMGLYELFISNMGIAKTSCYGSSLLGLFRLPERPKWLEIQSVNELKTKVGHVIVMVLLVGMFEKSKKVTICSPTDLLCFAASILLSSGCLYLLSRLHTSKTGGHV